MPAGLNGRHRSPFARMVAAPAEVADKDNPCLEGGSCCDGKEPLRLWADKESRVLLGRVKRLLMNMS